MTDSNEPSNHSRRDLLKITGTALATTTLTGCTALNNTEKTPTDTPTETPESTDLPEATGTTDTNTKTDTNTDTETGPFDAQTREQAQEIGQQVRKSTVKVKAGNAGGTGWILDTDNGHILTNAHVVRDLDTVTVTTFDENTYDGNVVGRNHEHIPDVALIQITDQDQSSFDHPALPVGNDTTLERDQALIQVGHPRRVGSWAVALGAYITHRNRVGWFESTLPTQSGNSGGPVVDLAGEVVGLTSGSTSADDAKEPSKHTENPPKLYTEYPKPENHATHVPITTAMELVESWTNQNQN